MPVDFQSIMDRWPDMRSFADECNVSLSTARAWVHRGRIPAEHWDAVIDAAAARGMPLSIDTMMGALRIALAQGEKSAIPMARSVQRKGARRHAS